MQASDDSSESPPWSRLRRDVWTVIWASFLAACLATMLFFACFDPLTLAADDQPPPWLQSRMSGYAIGFFFFWGVCFIAAAIAVFLLDDAVAPRADTSRDRPGIGS